jgi:hypothetical protein
MLIGVHRAHDMHFGCVDVSVPLLVGPCCIHMVDRRHCTCEPFLFERLSVFIFLVMLTLPYLGA